MFKALEINYPSFSVKKKKCNYGNDSVYLLCLMQIDGFGRIADPELGDELRVNMADEDLNVTLPRQKGSRMPSCWIIRAGRCRCRANSLTLRVFLFLTSSDGNVNYFISARFSFIVLLRIDKKL